LKILMFRQIPPAMLESLLKQNYHYKNTSPPLTSDVEPQKKYNDHMIINPSGSQNHSPITSKIVHSSSSGFFLNQDQTNEKALATRLAGSPRVGSHEKNQNSPPVNSQKHFQERNGLLLQESKIQTRLLFDEESQKENKLNIDQPAEHMKPDPCDDLWMTKNQELRPERKILINEKPYEAQKPDKIPRNEFYDRNQGFERNNMQKMIPNKGLRNLGNTCYLNALFQCLYHTERFRESMIAFQGQQGLPILSHLANLFIAMKTNDDYEIYNAQRNLMDKIQEVRLDVKTKEQGDSAFLFRALLEELSFNHEDFQYLPQLEMFAGSDLIKTKTCIRCNNQQKIHESIKILEVRDINFSEINQKNYFQSETETRSCTSCKSLKKFNCSYETSKLPEILVIRVQDTVNSMKRVEVLPEIFLREINHYQENGRSGQKIMQYEFFAGVLNQQKGEKGVHSVELSKHGGSYYEFNDFNVWEVELRNIRYHPKLLFYKRSS